MNTRNLESLRILARYETHSGYVWAMVADDGELICTPCVRANYRQVFRDTRDGQRSGWRCEGITHSGEHEGPAESCAHCGKEIFESTEDNES